MKQEEQLRVLNLLMWLQVAVYASDECEPIKWFYNHKTKQSLKQTIDAINKEHGKIIKAIWDADGVQMPLVTETLDKFIKLIAKLDYYKFPEINFLLELYNEGKLDTLIKFHQKLKTMSNYPAGAEHDPSAPYNQKKDHEDLCVYCDREEIEQIAIERAKNKATEMNIELKSGREQFDYHDFFDVYFQDEMDSRSECRSCYLHNHADDWEEDI